MKGKKLVPELRFPGFEGEWEEKRLGELCDKPKYGLNTSATEYDGCNGYIRITDIDESSNRFISSNITSPSEFSDEYLITNGDLLFARTGASVGKSYLYNESDGRLFFAGFLIKFSITDACPKFIFFKTLDAHFSRWIKIMSMRSGQPGINAEEYSSYSFSLPSLPEQQKIADFLSSVDKKIELLENQLKLQEEYKKGMMQKLFSQQIRFKDEYGKDFPDWEEKAAGELFYSHSNKKHNGDLPVLAVTQDKGVVLRDEIEYTVQASEASIKSYKIIEPGDFIISLRSFQGGIEYSNILGISSPAYTILKPSIEIIDSFYKYYLKKESFITELSNTVEGIRDGKNISYANFAPLRIPFPSLPEQQKIADFLSSLDKKIDNTKQQLEKAKDWKKGLMQKLFV